MTLVQKNFTLGVVSECLWGLGFGLYMPATLVSLALVDLGGSATLAGLLASLFSAGLTLPQAFSALALSPRFTDPVKTAWLHFPAITGPVISGLAFVLIPQGNPSDRLFWLLVGFGIFSVGIGVVVPHWASAIARCLPEKIRGRYFGVSFFASGLGSSLTGGLGAHWAAKGGLDWGYALCFLLAAPFMGLSLLVLTWMKPLTGRPAPPPPGAVLGAFKLMAGKLREPGPFRMGLTLVFLLVLVAAAGNLFTVYLMEKVRVDKVWFEWFTPAMSLGATVGAFFLGWLLDRRGIRPAFIAAFTAGFLSLVFICVSGGPFFPGLAYSAFGFLNAAFPVITLVMILKLAGSRNSSIQTGLFNTLMSPWSFAAPLCAGWLAAHAGYGWPFGAAVLCCLSAFWILWMDRSLDKMKKANQRKKGS